MPGKWFFQFWTLNHFGFITVFVVVVVVVVVVVA
jgi:hypothetical protein